MQSYTTWLLTNLPAFFMSEPICYLWGIALLAYLVRVILSFKG